MELRQSKAYFSERILAWYRANRRDLPWRRSGDPYHIWVSEIMLQQTRVDTVIPYFQRFIGRFPTVSALAEAEEDEVLKLWEGLGYYSRARNLQSSVREVKERYGGEVPAEKERLSNLKGIGPYTAGAILSIAYNQPAPAVDGNVMRLLARFFLLEMDIAKSSTRVHMEQLVSELFPTGAAGDFTQALMEMGALVCTPKSPNCPACPVRDHCAARDEGVVDLLPYKAKAKPPRVEPRFVALVEGHGASAGKILIRRRPDRGLLANMWELPHVLTGEGVEGALAFAQGDELANGLADAVGGGGIRMFAQGHFMDIDHIFSHIRWKLQVYRCGIERERVENQREQGHFEADRVGVDSDGGENVRFYLGDGADYAWLSADRVGEFAFPQVFLKIISRYFSLTQAEID